MRRHIPLASSRSSAYVILLASRSSIATHRAASLEPAADRARRLAREAAQTPKFRRPT